MVPDKFLLNRIISAYLIIWVPVPVRTITVYSTVGTIEDGPYERMHAP
jgi:hypothetical protein